MFRNVVSRVVHRSPEEVFAYLADVRRMPEWTHSEGMRFDEAEQHVGARAVQTVKFMGMRRDVELITTAFDRPRRIAFHSSVPFPIDFGFSLAPAPGGTQLSYDVAMQPNGLFALLIPLAAGRQNRKDFASLVDHLEAGGGRASATA
jgi:hypothetical protein